MRRPEDGGSEVGLGALKRTQPCRGGAGPGKSSRRRDFLGAVSPVGDADVPWRRICRRRPAWVANSGYTPSLESGTSRAGELTEEAVDVDAGYR